MELEPRPVADFHGATTAALDDLGVTVSILARPVEVPESTPFAEDGRRCSYDARAAHRFWLARVQAHRIMHASRSRFAA